MSKSEIESDDEITITVEHYNDNVDLLTNYDTLKKQNITNPKMTRYEKCKIIGLRAQQLAGGAEPLINPEKYMTDVLQIAEEELRLQKIPFILKRKFANKIEYWKIEDMVIN